MSTVATAGTTPVTLSVPNNDTDDAESGSKAGEEIVNGKPKGEMHWVMLMFMTYIAVYGGGAYVTEDQVATGYPLLTFIGLILMPWICGFPVALMVAELCSAMPVNGGYIVWMQEAFGPFWGFQMGWLQTISRIIDLALYPVLFTEYAQQYFEFPNWMAPIFNLAVVLVSTALNILGVQIMGWASVAMACVSLSPFIIFSFYGASQVDPRTWIITPPDWTQVDWGLYLAVAYWNVSGFDSLSQVAGEVKDPRKYYWGMMGAMILVTLSGFIPLSIMVSVDQDYQNYYAGYWPEIGGMVAGEWLRILFTIGACVSMFATFNGYLFYGAIQISVWCERDFLDIPILTSVSRFNTPWVSVLTHATIVYALSFLDFEDLIQASTAAYCAAVILEYFALIDLRISKPDMPRPYKIGLGTKGLIAFVTPAVLISSMNIVFAMAANYLSFAIILSFFVLGPVLWFARNAIRDKVEGLKKNPYDDLLKDDEAAKLLKIVKAPLGPSVVSMPPKTKPQKPSLMRSDSDLDADTPQIPLSTSPPKTKNAKNDALVDLDD